MTVAQEDALYAFLDDVQEPFSTADATAAVRRKEPGGARRLAEEVGAFLESRRLAFPSGEGRWVSRRGFFGSARFSVVPTRLEIRNGILIPGHRCLPFVNPILLPHELQFLYSGEQLPVTTSEGPPEDFYPYYDLFGEEYAPQYLARDNPENEESFNADPYEDPPEVSVRTLDMRALYRELSFVPGDRFVARVIDWKGGVFELEKEAGPQDEAYKAELAEWMEAAERGFLASFDSVGPGASTEEQIAFACWHGGDRMLRTPAYSMEEFIYEKTERIETVPYGMETRFWRAGKDIPDRGPWTLEAGPPDKTEVETVLSRLGIPVSEYVVESYIRDSFFRDDSDIHRILERLIPPSVEADHAERLFVAQFISEARADLISTYNFFADREMGVLRSRAAELHGAVIEMLAKFGRKGVDVSWLPKHALVTLSQLQTHAANLLEDLDFDDPPDPRELDGMDNSLDAMIDTFDDLKEAMDQAVNGFRRSRMTLVKAEASDKGGDWRVLQISLSGTSVWRRISVPEGMNLESLHRCIQASLGWKGGRLHGFVVDGQVYGPEGEGGDYTERGTTVGALAEAGKTEFVYDYDYGAEWEARVTVLHEAEAEADGIPRCLAGEGVAPPESIGGPLRFRRFVTALASDAGKERELARAELGADFDPEAFDPAAANAALRKEFEKGDSDGRD